MLVVTAEQMAVVGRTAFEQQMAAHLRAFSPLVLNAIGEAQLRGMVRLGIERAHGYGFTFRGPVRLYLELMLLFGSHFDTDPQYSWSADILRRAAEPQMRRADSLYRKTLDYRAAVAGPEDAHTFAALPRIRALVRQPPALTRESFIQVMAVEITHAYPQKAAYLGAHGMDSLIRAGILGGRELGLATLRSFARMTMLMLAFGHGCARDPLYPWIERTLKDPAIADIEARVRRLEDETLTWLDQLLAHPDGGSPA